MIQRVAAHGMRTFSVVWFGQIISSLGSNLTTFAVGVWVYQSTGSVTRFGILSVSHLMPSLIMAPLVGWVVDRWDRRWVMVISDSVAGVGTLTLLFLVWTDRLALGYLCIIVFIISACNTFQGPAFTSSVSLLIPKQHLGRASGMRQAGGAGVRILAPLLAGVLLVKIHLEGIIAVDIVTWMIAVGALLIIRLPKPEPTAEGEKSKGGFWREALYGLTFIRERAGLMALLLMFTVINLSIAMITVLLTPLLLSFGSADVLGGVLSTASVGALVGGVLMGVWGGPKKRIRGIFLLATALPLIIVIGGLRPDALLIAGAAAAVMFIAPMIAGTSQAFWQSKVPPDLQGRVFAMRIMITRSLAPVAFLVAGPLADYVFEPLLAVDGPLAGTVGQIIGVGPGRGVGLMFITLGIAVGLTLAVGYMNPRLRNVEKELPDAI